MLDTCGRHARSLGAKSRPNKSLNRSWLAFWFFKVVFFVYGFRFINVQSVGPPTRLTQTLAGPRRRVELPPDVDIPAQIAKQIEYLLRTRAVFPVIGESAVGHTSFSTAPYYQQAGINVEVRFAEPITLGQVQIINSIGHWINQNFAIRLCALLEYYGVIPPQGQGKLNESLPGFQDINIVRRLRNVLAHTSGRYNSTVPEERKLYETMVTHYGVVGADPDTATKFPLSIDAVLVPMARGCQKYAQAWENDGAG